jgi:hypothetical protein
MVTSYDFNEMRRILANWSSGLPLDVLVMSTYRLNAPSTVTLRKA